MITRKLFNNKLRVQFHVSKPKQAQVRFTVAYKLQGVIFCIVFHTIIQYAENELIIYIRLGWVNFINEVRYIFKKKSFIFVYPRKQSVRCICHSDLSSPDAVEM